MMLITLVMLKSFITLLPNSVAPSLHAKCDKPSELGFNIMRKKQEIELWEDVPYTNGDYQISNFGRMRSWICKGGHDRKRRIEPLILKTPLSSTGYPSLSMYFSGIKKIKTIRVHHFVAKMFVPNPNNYKLVLHIDDNPLNPHYTNLKWGTNLENTQDAFIKGRIIPAKGLARKKSSLTENDVRKIFKSKLTCVVLAEKYNVNPTCISDIRSGRSWNHITGLLCTRKKKPKFSKDIIFKQ